MDTDSAEVLVTKKSPQAFHRIDESGGAACGVFDGPATYPDECASYYSGPTGQVEKGETVEHIDRDVAECFGLSPCSRCFDGSGIDMTVREIKAELASVTGLEFEGGASHITKADAYALLQWAKEMEVRADA